MFSEVGFDIANALFDAIEWRTRANILFNEEVFHT
jgi:hypothetical protein